MTQAERLERFNTAKNKAEERHGFAEVQKMLPEIAREHGFRFRVDSTGPVPELVLEDTEEES
ncbi:hypothetical protein LCGC14_0165490 [marine sediment metagenome]|uniref:Uncharacterized protein n=1 Tax=marine sediment metagenome TaxID=412755 RepID=A0A0F9XWY2_9ZZZZ